MYSLFAKRPPILNHKDQLQPLQVDTFQTIPIIFQIQQKKIKNQSQKTKKKVGKRKLDVEEAQGHLEGLKLSSIVSNNV